MSERLSGPVRARDLRANILQLGFDKGVVTTMELFLEEFAQHRQQMRELTQLVDQCIDQIGKFVAIGEGIKSKVTELERIRKQGEEHE